MDNPIIHPPRLKTGDAIAIVAPAGPIQSRENLEHGIVILEKMGFRVRFEDRIFESSGYLAGKDADRAEELTRAFEDPDINAIIGLRGGYGCSRLIPFLQQKMRKFPKIFVGFSDLTTLHMFFQKNFGWITFHGPMATTIAKHSQDQENHLLSLLTDPGYRPSFSFPQLQAWNPGKAEGPLTGGCLSIVTAGIGTPYEIETYGKILFLEDLGEPAYRLDRMLTHLKLAGKLDKAAGLLLGTFSDCSIQDQHDATAGETSVFSEQEVIRDVLKDLTIPILADFPAGHGKDHWTLPLGAKIKLDADNRTIQFLDPAVR
jgi:muramoyltetrapeptide carboxypeptidase